MANQYFVKTDSGIGGPFTGGQLKQMAEAGSLARTSLISVDQSKWVSAESIKGLTFPHLPPELSPPTEIVAEHSTPGDTESSPHKTSHSVQTRCDILISYRRKGGSEIARYVAEALRRSGYSVFLDVDGLGGGSWSDELEQRIAECKDFIPIITEGFFDRCGSADDVVRKELLHAIENNKSIIPLIATDHPFPDSIPPEIASISSYNCVRYVHDYAPKAIEKLRAMLASRAGGPERLYSGEAQPRVILACVAMLFGAWFGADMGMEAAGGPFNAPIGLYESAARGLFWALVLQIAIVIPGLLLITFLAARFNIRADRIYGGSWLPFWFLTIPAVIFLTTVFVAMVFSTLGIESYFAGGLLGQLFAVSYVVFVIKFKVWTPFGEMLSMVRG